MLIPHNLLSEGADKRVDEKGLLIEGTLDTSSTNTALTVPDHSRGPDANGPDLNQVLAYWEQFYREILDIEIYTENIIIPPRKPGFDHLLIVGRNLTHTKCWDTIRDLGNFTQYTHSSMHRGDGAFAWHERVPIVTYAIWIRNNFSIEKDLIGVTAKEVEVRDMCTMTSLERLLLSVIALSPRSNLPWQERWCNTPDDLSIMFDRYTMTLCSGTRTVHGSVPVISTFSNDGRRYEYTERIHPDGYSFVGDLNGNNFCVRENVETKKVHEVLGPREVICDMRSPAFHALGSLQEARGKLFLNLETRGKKLPLITTVKRLGLRKERKIS